MKSCMVPNGTENTVIRNPDNGNKSAKRRLGISWSYQKYFMSSHAVSTNNNGHPKFKK